MAPRSVSIEGLEVPCEITGVGRPLVLIHGVGGSRRLWQRLQPRLSAEYCVVAYDLRGSGDSREVAPGGSEFSLRRWARDLNELLQVLELGRPTLVGHSLGSSIALKVALCWPESVASLVLMGADPELSRVGSRMRKAANLIAELGIEGWLEEHWSRNTPFSDASLQRDPTIVDEYRAMVLANGADDYVRTWLAVADSETLTGELSQIAHPCLVIAGSDDDRTLPSAGRELATSLPNAAFVELEGVGHTMPLEAPAEVADAIIEFLTPNRLLAQHGGPDGAEQ